MTRVGETTHYKYAGSGDILIAIKKKDTNNYGTGIPFYVHVAGTDDTSIEGVNGLAGFFGLADREWDVEVEKRAAGKFVSVTTNDSKKQFTVDFFSVVTPEDSSAQY